MEEPIDSILKPEPKTEVEPEKKELRVKYIFILGIFLLSVGLILSALLNGSNEKIFTSSTADEQIIGTLIFSGLLAIVAGTIKLITKKRTN